MVSRLYFLINTVIVVLTVVFILSAIIIHFKLRGRAYFGLYIDGKMEILSPSQRSKLEINEGTEETVKAIVDFLYNY